MCLSVSPSHQNAGYNTHGQLGVAHKNTVETPQALASHRWKALSLGDGHAAGVGDGVSSSLNVYSFSSSFLAQPSPAPHLALS